MKTSEDDSLPGMTVGARAAADFERNMTIKEAINHCWKALCWSLIFTTAIIMEGFDLALLSGFYAFSAFQRRYGVEVENGKYEIPAEWQTALSAGAQIGQIIGLSIAGMFVQRVGYRKTMLVALTLMIAFIFVPVFAPNIATLMVGEILQGIPWGVFETMPAAYASEIAPLVLRPYFTTYANLCWVIGQLIATGVLRGFLGLGDSQWAYRVPFMLQWIWPIPILTCVWMAPESPWWLARRGDYGGARKSLQRISNYKDQENHNKFELIKHTILADKKMHVELEDSAPKTQLGKLRESLCTYRQCFEGVDRRRTEINCMTWVSQSLCGSNLIAFAPLFFQTAGISEENSFTIQVVALAMGALGTVSAWFLMKSIGRRTIYVSGLAALFVLLLLIGVVYAACGENNNVANWAVAVLLVVYIVVYDLSLGPCCYSIVTEIPSSKLRAPTIALARICYNLCGIFSVAMNPQMLNASAWNWGPRAALFWSGLCFLCLVWAFFRLPEPKGRNQGELDVLFAQKIKARDFAKTQADQFGVDDVEAFGGPPSVVHSSLIRRNPSREA
ncbi:general substrate transporter [Truncatella angustata]|uniref:General substrate transporter n=1 Tax=Truncatella angustata TaxID=152316 RepID=A0A9P8UKY6_9PEZI|nr:general substrate transporter [Truncatella angustata]KAH6654086.1 general substrate transporter [Truncatella angustata]